MDSKVIGRGQTYRQTDMLAMLQACFHFLQMKVGQKETKMKMKLFYEKEKRNHVLKLWKVWHVIWQFGQPFVIMFIYNLFNDAFSVILIVKRRIISDKLMINRENVKRSDGRII
jgi:hypothetical protein